MRFVGETIACWDPHGGTNHLSWKKNQVQLSLDLGLFSEGQLKLHIFANDFGLQSFVNAVRLLNNEYNDV